MRDSLPARGRASVTTSADQADREELNARSSEQAKLRAVAPSRSAPVGETGDAALLVGNVTGDGDGATILDPIEEIRESARSRGGLEASPGPAGFAAMRQGVEKSRHAAGSALLLVVFS